jgi:hypothetical protein
MANVRTEFYEQTYKRALENIKNQEAKDFMIEFHKKYEGLFKVLEDQTISQEEKLSKVHEFETLHQKNLGEMLNNDASSVENKFIETSQMGISASKDQTGAVIPIIEFYCENYNTDQLLKCFDLDLIYKSDYLKSEAKMYEDKILKSQDKALKEKKLLGIDGLLKMDEFSEKKRNKQREHINAARKLLLKYKKNNKELIISELSEKNYKILKKGISALQITTIKASNYVMTIAKNSPANLTQDISKNKDYLIKITSTLSVKTEIPIKNREKIFANANLNLSNDTKEMLFRERTGFLREQNQNNVAMLRSLLQEQQLKLADMNQRKTDSLAGNFLGELNITLKRAQDAYKKLPHKNISLPPNMPPPPLPDDLKPKASISVPPTTKPPPLPPDVQQIRLKAERFRYLLNFQNEQIRLIERGRTTQLKSLPTKFLDLIAKELRTDQGKQYLNDHPEFKEEFYLTTVRFALKGVDSYLQNAKKPDYELAKQCLVELKKLPEMDTFLKQNTDVPVKKIDDYILMISRMGSQNRVDEQKEESNRQRRREGITARREGNISKSAVAKKEETATYRRPLPDIPQPEEAQHLHKLGMFSHQDKITEEKPKEIQAIKKGVK